MPSPSVTATAEVRLQVDELRGSFAYAQLPPRLQEISKPFGEHAQRICGEPVWGLQTVLALTHLLIAKDAAVRAALHSDRFLAHDRLKESSG